MWQSSSARWTATRASERCRMIGSALVQDKPPLADDSLELLGHDGAEAPAQTGLDKRGPRLLSKQPRQTRDLRNRALRATDVFAFWRHRALPSRARECGPRGFVSRYSLKTRDHFVKADNWAHGAWNAGRASASVVFSELR